MNELKGADENWEPAPKPVERMKHKREEQANEMSKPIWVWLNWL